MMPSGSEQLRHRRTLGGNEAGPPTPSAAAVHPRGRPGEMKKMNDTPRNSSAADQPVFSIVAPVFDEAETLPRFYERTAAVLERMGEPFELILVDDGSTDASPEVLRLLLARDHRVRVITFSRNFGHQVAISAGLDHARGQAVVVMDSDLQDPPEVIPRLIEKWRSGSEVVYAQRAARDGETGLKLATAALFYRLIGCLTSVDIPRDTGDFRLLDRKVVEVLRTMREHHRFVRGLSAWVGFQQEPVRYHREERFAGTTKYPLHAMIRFAADAITSFSHVPLQIATTLGFVLAGGSMIGILVALGLRLLTHAIIGQASTLILVLLMGGMQLIFLGVIGAYLARIHDEVRARPLYVVRDEEPRNRSKARSLTTERSRMAPVLGPARESHEGIGRPTSRSNPRSSQRQNLRY